MLSIPATVQFQNNNAFGNGFTLGPFQFPDPPSMEVVLDISTPFCSKHLKGPSYPGGTAQEIGCECQYEEIECGRLKHDHLCKCGEGHTCNEKDWSCQPHLPNENDHPLEQLAHIQGHPSNLRARITHLEEENAALRERLDRLEALLTKENLAHEASA